MSSESTAGQIPDCKLPSFIIGQFVSFIEFQCKKNSIRGETRSVKDVQVTPVFKTPGPEGPYRMRLSLKSHP